MAFPKFHGIQLADNSWIENLHIEQLATDPATVTAGHVWLNTTEGVFKYGVLEGAVVVVRSIYDQASATAAIAALQASIDVVSGDVALEVAARISAIETLTLAITTESLARTTAIAEASLASAAALTIETDARIAADAVMAATAADQLATETTARLAGDAALDARVDAVQTELNATQAGSGLGVDGAYVVPVGSSFLDTSTSLANAQALFDAALAAEAATRAGTDAALASAIANEAQLRTDGDAGLQAQLTAYIDSAVTNNTNADNAETIARIAADQLLQAEIDRTQAAIGLDTDGNLIPITGTNYLNPATTVFGGAAILDIELARVDTSLTGEIAARAAAIAQATSDLQAEALVREQADTAQQQEINAIEAGAGLEADGTYAAPTGSNYLNLSTSLKDADFKLDAALKAAADKVTVIETTTIPAVQATVSAEQARALAAEQSLLDAINSAQSGGSTATADLKTAINAGRFTFKSTVPALVHVVTHGMASEFVQYAIMVEGADLVYRNDIVPVEETDANTLTVTLSEARNIKISVLNAVSLI